MKNSKITLLLSLIILASISLTSCKDEKPVDACASITCQNAGVCNEGICSCQTGFSGTLCENEDLCITQNVTCLNGGTCDNGVCACALGYEGTDCSTLVRAKYLGSKAGTETCTSGTSMYVVDITGAAADVDVQIQNLYGAGFITGATVAANGNINIPSQSFGTGMIVGDVTINSSNTTIDFIVSSGGAADTCQWVSN